MPVTTRILVKTSLLYLGVGAVLGALMLMGRWLPLGRWVAYVRVSHIQMLTIGWLTQLVVGVTWWLLPLLAHVRDQEGLPPMQRAQARRGSEPLFWATFVCLNSSVLLRAVFDPLYSWTRNGAFGFLAGISELFLLAAVAAFVGNTWRRVRAMGRSR